jgi:branched-chain amino acid transport system permease protein
MQDTPIELHPAVLRFAKRLRRAREAKGLSLSVVAQTVGTSQQYLSLVEKGVNFWVAIVITLGVMVVLGISIERLVLRPLVNQPQITLFMATIGLTFVLEGLSQLFWGAQQ